MANIQERRDKSGKLISYSIRVFRGRGADGKQLKPWTATFDVSPTWTEKSARKKAETFAAQFERDCKAGVATDTRLRFDEYTRYVFDLKEKNKQLKPSTLVRYEELSERAFAELGHVKLKDIRADMLNAFYLKLGKKGVKKTVNKAVAVADLPAVLKDKKISRMKIAAETGLAPSTVNAAVRGDSVSEETARKVCDYLGLKLEKTFLVSSENAALSAKTILEYHRMISSVLEQAVKEQLIPFNPAAKATLPKVEKKTPNYFQPQQVDDILTALESEPLKWRALTHLLIASGCRRGEALGLKWDSVDFSNNRVHIENNVVYDPEHGVYEGSTKTETAVRWLNLPAFTMDILREWRKEQLKHITAVGDYYNNQNFVFARDDGGAMHPDSVTDWMNKFSKRHGLPHINPHAFRHTQASILASANVSDVTLAGRLGHSNAAFTKKQYAHMFEDADKTSADIIANAFQKRA